MPTPSSVIEVRAEYGGLPIALAITGQPDPYNTAAITYEVTTALLALYALVGRAG